MTTDPTPLQERLWDAIFEARDLPGKAGEASTVSIVEAILPIIAAEVRKAQADALREAARDLSWFGAQGNTLDHLCAWDVVQTCMKAIESTADRIEKED